MRAELLVNPVNCTSRVAMIVNAQIYHLYVTTKLVEVEIAAFGIIYGIDVDGFLMYQSFPIQLNDHC